MNSRFSQQTFRTRDTAERRSKVLTSILVLLSIIILTACGERGSTAAPTEDTNSNEAVVGDSTDTVDTAADTTDDAAVETTVDTNNTPATSDVITIKFAVSEFMMGTYSSLVKTFEEENPGIRIKVVSADGLLGIDPTAGSFDLPDDGDERLARGADVISTNFGSFNASTVERGVVLDLSPLIAGDTAFDSADFWPGLLPDEGAIAALPSEVSFNLVFYDKDMFDAAGVPYPEPGWSFDDLRTAAQALTIRDGDDVTQWGFVQPFTDPTPLVEGQLSTPAIDNATDPPTIRFEDEDVIAAVQWLADLYLVDHSSPYLALPDEEEFSGFSLPEGFRIIEEGQAAIWTENSQSFGFRESARNIGVVPFPVADGTPYNGDAFISGIAISAGTANPLAAWQWLSFLSSQQAPEFDFGGRTNLPVRRSLAESTNFWDEVNPELGAALRFIVDRGVNETTFRTQALNDAMDQIIQAGTAIDVALKEAQATAESELTEEEEAEPVEAFSVIADKAEAAANSDAVTITFVTFGGGLDFGQYRDLAEQFTQQNPGILVEVRPPDFAGSLDINMQTVAQDTDCFQWFSEVQNEEYQSAILTLDPFVDADADFSLDDFYPAMVDQFRYQGQLWGVPAELTPLTINYNKDLFDAAGVDYPSADWNLQQFVDLAIATTEGEGEFKTYGFVPDAFENNILLLMLEKQGAVLVDVSQDPPTMNMNAADTVAAVRWYLDLHTQLGVKPAFITDPTDFGSSTGMFADREGIIDEGRAAMWTDSGQAGGGFGLGDRSSMNIGVAPIPSGSGGAGLLPASGYFISADTDLRRECWDWIKFLTESPDVVVGLPGRISVAESAEFRNKVGAERADAYISTMQAEADAENTIFRLFSGDNDWMGVGTFWLGRAHQSVIDGDATVEEALDEAQRTFDEYRNCVIANDAFSDSDAQNSCLSEVDPTLPSFLLGG